LGSSRKAITPLSATASRPNDRQTPSLLSDGNLRGPGDQHHKTAMPVRIPPARGTEVLSFGVAGVGVFAPFYLLLPGAEERLATQTARWAPRWERNIGYVAPRIERGIQRVAPPVERTVQKIDGRLPLEMVAKRVDKNIKKSIERGASAMKR